MIIGEAIYVHQQLGPGLLESVYETCLVHRLVKSGLGLTVQQPIPLFFEEVKMECGFRCDIIVENKVIVEVKAVEALSDIHLAQVLTYLKLTNLKLGLLMNFNVLKIKDGLRRVVNNL
jgi:GxxExxY protein